MRTKILSNLEVSSSQTIYRPSLATRYHDFYPNFLHCWPTVPAARARPTFMGSRESRPVGDFFFHVTVIAVVLP